MSLPPTPSGTRNLAVDDPALDHLPPDDPSTEGSAVRGRLAQVRHRVRDGGREAGMTTAEYAVGTVAACGFGGVLYKVITDDSIVSLLGKLFAKALKVSF